MPHYAYGAEHRRVRQVLLATTPPGTMCPFADSDPKCPGPMYPGAELLDLNHSEAWMKQAGKPGDQLAHRACNRRASNKRVTPEAAARKQRQHEKDQATLDKVAPTHGCYHTEPWDKVPVYRGQTQTGALVALPDGLTWLPGAQPLYGSQNGPACQHCGGWPRSRIWA